jgi:hypothetical protein
MEPIYPPTVVYAWDLADTFFTLEQMRAARIAAGWKPVGDVRDVFIKGGPNAGIRKRQCYTRLEHQAVVRPKLDHATAETHEPFAAAKPRLAHARRWPWQTSAEKT